MHRFASRALGVLAATLLVAGCSGTDRPDPEPSAPSAPSEGTPTAPVQPTPSTQYVALGDSYAAAPGVPETSGVDGCFRSDRNYAHLVAADDDTIALTDVTCSGATTSDVLEKQVLALDAGTDLVTVGIGGNDDDLFTSVLSSCLQGADPAAPGTPCTDATAGRVAAALPRIEANVGTTLDAIGAAAPEARVIVVGYPDLIPTSGTCPDRLPLAAGDYPFLDGITRGLSEALSAQATERDLDFVDVARASQGHDICAEVPWVNGIDVAPDGTIPFHPLAVEQRNIARLIARLLLDPTGS